jgi:drug/metabolite transporter (DMT)-like permease
MLLAAVGIAVYVRISKQSLVVSWRNFIGLVVVGTIVAAHWICFFMAIQVSNVSVTLAVIACTAFFTALVEPIFFKRKIEIYELLLGAVVVAAVGFIFKFEIQYQLGIVLALASAIFAAFFGVINGTFITKIPAATISFYEMAMGFVGINIYLWATNMPWQLPPTAADWLYILLLAWVCTAFAFVASVHILKKITPYTVALSVNLEPIYGITMAYFLFPNTEKMTPNFYVGAGIILLSVVANALLKSYQRNTKKLS